MRAFLEILWVAGFALLLGWLVRAVAVARTRPRAPVARSVVAAAAIAVGALGLGSAYVWGVDFARDGMTRILEDDDGRHAPARARLFMRHVQLLLREPADDGHAARVGYSPDAGLRLPRGYDLTESTRGWDVLRVEAPGPQGLTVAAIDNHEASQTRVVLGAARRGSGGAPDPDAMERSARDLAGRGADRCKVRGDHETLDGPGVVYAVLCVGRTPKAALAFERDLNAARDTRDATPVRVTPMVWTGNRFRPHHVQIATGSLIQIGAMADALPGVTLWEVPAPQGRAELFFPPSNLHDSCSEWLQSSPAGDRGFVSARIDEGRLARTTPSADDDPVCVLPFTPPFGLEVRRLLPDYPGITARSLWAAGLLITPALFLLVFLCAQARSQITARRFARTLALSWITVFFAAVAVWRLLWAHRIDMLRDYESVGARVLGNQVLLVLAGAAFAAAAVLCWTPLTRRWRRLGLAAAAWGAWLVLGGWALRGDLADLDLGLRLIGQIAISFAIGTTPAWGPPLADVARARADRLADRFELPRELRVWGAAIAGLLVLALAALLASRLAPRAVGLKLGFAWALVVIFYTALRGAIDPRGLAPWRVLATFVAGGVAGVCMASFDPGVTAAIAFPGIVLAILFASHDARYGEASVRRMAAFERHHAPLVIAQAVMAGLGGAAVAVWSLAGLAGHAGDATFARSLTLGAVHLLLFLALLFVPAAIVAYRRRGALAAAPWLVAAVLLFGAWAGRGALLDRAVSSSSQASSRIAIVTDPAYAILRNETKFLAGITAWRETIVPGEGADLADGQGYFGAQLIDPGVLLSVENDYLPVLVLREAGVRGVVLVAFILLLLVTGLWLVSGDRFRHGSAAQRARGLAALVLGVLCIYQPLASLGVLPLTGIAWPGLGLDSPSDFWLLIALVSWIALWGRERRANDADEERLDEMDADLRTSRLFRRVRLGVGATTGLLAVAGLLLLGRAAAFALERPNPVDAEGRAVAPFDGLRQAIDYAAFQLQCPDDRPEGDADAIVPMQLLGDPESTGVKRFHHQMMSTWETSRPRAVAELDRFLAGDAEACRGRAGPWRFARGGEDGAVCTATFKAGWPEVVIEARATGDKDGTATARCDVDTATEVLRALRLPVRRPFRDARIRLVSRAMGAAARDVGELISGHLAVRLRPGAGEIDVASARAGLYLGDRVHISDQLTLVVEDGRAVLHARAPAGAAPKSTAADLTKPDEEAYLFMRDAPPPRIHVLEAEEGAWRLLPPGTREIALDRVALIVVGGRDARSLWLFRPPSVGSGARPTVDPLLADDITTVRGERRRHYLYGGLVPELGWVNPFHQRGSLGLDGWIRVATTEYDEARRDPIAAAAGYCGTLGAEPPRSIERVCKPNPVDGVLECRVALQPELAIRLRHLTELIALRPERFAPSKERRGEDPPVEPRPVRSSFALIRGDTGEIVAQGEMVPGRASSAYAPATPELEQYLIRLREDRDPRTGQKLPRVRRGQASAEKAEWGQPIAVGSTMKPLLGRALELADPIYARHLELEGHPKAGARCRDRRVHAILGHCPPTDSLWDRAEAYPSVDMAVFIAHSLNWYQAAIGLLGTAVPHGEHGFGDRDADTGDADDLEGDLAEPRDVGDHKTSDALWTRFRGKKVISSKGTVNVAHLRESAMWDRFEKLLGRPLCTAGNKRLCRQHAARGDLCAARALPIDEPSRDLRHLVATGPAALDFYPVLRDPDKTVTWVSTREYLQFLRGSGLHPLGSLLQLTDAFNRLVYEHARDPAEDGAYRLAASWFPVAAAGALPPWTCADPSRATDVAAGLCGAIIRGTATRDLEPLLDDDRLVLYGAKTGTIDSLADIAENEEACHRFNEAHTVASRDRTLDDQPYWLPCGEKTKRTQNAVNDTLLVLSFGVRTDQGIVPFTLGLRFQRSGLGFATRVARHYVDAVADYFGPPRD